MKVYLCENCNEKLEEDRMITLGSDNNKLKFENSIPTKDRKIIDLGRHQDVHFCNRKCFVGYFFVSENN